MSGNGGGWEEAKARYDGTRRKGEQREGGEAKRNAAERSGAPSLVAAQRRAASYFVVPRLIAFQNGSVQNRLDDPPFVLVQTLEAHRSSSGADCERASSLPGVNPDKLNRTLSRVSLADSNFLGASRATRLDATDPFVQPLSTTMSSILRFHLNRPVEQSAQSDESREEERGLCDDALVSGASTALMEEETRPPYRRY